MSKDLSTFGKICIHVGFCFVIVIFFGKNTVLRPPAYNTMYKEYITGLLPLALFYGNRLVLFPQLFLKERLFAYICSITLCLIAITCAEIAFVYPQVEPVLVSMFGDVAVKNLFVYYLPIIILRNSGFVLFSFAFCDIRHQAALKNKYESRLKEIAGEVDIQKTEHESGLAKIKDILYCQQFKNYTWVVMEGGGFYTRYGSLKTMKNLLGEDLLIDVSKGLLVMQDKIHSYDETSITIRDPVQDKLYPFEWGAGYYESVCRILSVRSSQETMESVLENTSEKTNKPSSSSTNRKHLIAVLKKHQNFRPVYLYIRRHPDCKASKIASSLPIPTGSLNHILKQFKDEGIIEHTGSKKTGGYRVVEG